MAHVGFDLKKWQFLQHGRLSEDALSLFVTVFILIMHWKSHILGCLCGSFLYIDVTTVLRRTDVTGLQNTIN